MRRWAPLGRISNSFGWQECVVRISMPTWLFLKSYYLLVRVDQLWIVSRNRQLLCHPETYHKEKKRLQEKYVVVMNIELRYHSHKSANHFLLD